MRLLLVEDDSRFGAALVRGLEHHGFRVSWARDAASAHRLVHDTEFDAIVVDWMLPDGDGPSVIQRMRRHGITTPVIMLTARDAIEDRVRGLDAGADDYLVKPFHLDELLARIRALSRRPAGHSPARIGLGTLVLDVASRTARLDGRSVDLTPGETAVLETLLAHVPGAATRGVLADSIAEADGSGTVGSIETHVSRLRAKLRGGAVQIRTLRALGYRIEHAS